MWYVYDDDGAYYVASRLAPQTARAERDCVVGPITHEQLQELRSELDRSIIMH